MQKSQLLALMIKPLSWSSIDIKARIIERTISWITLNYCLMWSARSNCLKLLCSRQSRKRKGSSTWRTYIKSQNIWKSNPKLSSNKFWQKGSSLYTFLMGMWTCISTLRAEIGIQTMQFKIRGKNTKALLINATSGAIAATNISAIRNIRSTGKKN